MVEMSERYDSALLGILQNEGQIANFLEAIFGFLYRRTDFYVIMKEKTDRMGFPPGVALRLAVGAFKKFEELAARQAKIREQQLEAERKKPKATQAECQGAAVKGKNEPMPCQNKAHVEKGAAVNEQVKVEPVAVKVEKSADAEAKVDGARQKDKPEGNDKENQSTSTGEDSRMDVSVSEHEKTDKKDAKTPGKAGETDGTTSSKPEATSSAAKTDKYDPDEDPVLAEQQKQFQANPYSYNGAVRENYSWSQSITDVDVFVKVPPNIRKGRDVKVTIGRQSLTVTARDAESEGGMQSLVEGKLTWPVHVEESMWSLVPAEHVHVNLEKVQERWWDAVYESEPRISVRKIDPSRPITDLDEEAQAKIDEMMYNERQKRLGRPQSHEQKVHDILKNAWDAEGSPFKGQPFDPSLVNVQNPSGGGFPMPPGGGGAS